MEHHSLREDLALALRAAAWHGLSEGVCNHFSVAVDRDRFLLNPRGLHWSEVLADDILLVDGKGQVLDGRHRAEPTALFIHAAVHRIAGHAVVLHTHMPYATSLTLTEAGAIDPLLSQNALRFHGRIAVDAQYNGLALDAAEGARTDADTAHGSGVWRYLLALVLALSAELISFAAPDGMAWKAAGMALAAAALLAQLRGQ